MPDPLVMTTAFYNEYVYYSHENPTGKNGQTIARKILKELGRLKNIKRICELGCGNGYLANELALEGYDVTGVDFSESGIQHAMAGYGKKVNFVFAEINADLPRKLGEKKYDAVIASEVIEHLYKPSDLIEAANALLKETGYLLLTTPYHGYLKNLAITVLNQTDKHFNPLWDGGHIKFFGMKTMTTLLEKHSFKVHQYTFYGRIPWLWKSMICLAQKEGD